MSKKGVEDMKRVLIVVDVQNDFVDGVLGSKEAQAISPAVKAKIEKYDKYGREILFTRDSQDVYKRQGYTYGYNDGLVDLLNRLGIKHHEQIMND